MCTHTAVDRHAHTTTDEPTQHTHRTTTVRLTQVKTPKGIDAAEVHCSGKLSPQSSMLASHTHMHTHLLRPRVDSAAGTSGAEQLHHLPALAAAVRQRARLLAVQPAGQLRVLARQPPFLPCQPRLPGLPHLLVALGSGAEGTAQGRHGPVRFGLRSTKHEGVAH